MGRKKPRKKINQSGDGAVGGVKKQVKDPNQPSNMSQNPCWQLAKLQLNGSYGWTAIERDKLLEIHGKLSNLEKMTWGEIQKKPDNFHSVEINSLSKSAQQELAKLKLDDISELYSIRMSGEERVWGIKVGSIVRLLWWDPQHQVCLSHKKHT